MTEEAKLKQALKEATEILNGGPFKLIPYNGESKCYFDIVDKKCEKIGEVSFYSAHQAAIFLEMLNAGYEETLKNIPTLEQHLNLDSDY